MGKLRLRMFDGECWEEYSDPGRKKKNEIN
jgi:hypothetical protein